MRKYNRIFLIVLDSLGIGAMADSEKFGDVGVNTFGHIWESQGGLEIPNLRRLGMGNLCGVTEDVSTITALTTVSAMSAASSAIKSKGFPSLSVNPSRESRLFFVSNFFR